MAPGRTYASKAGAYRRKDLRRHREQRSPGVVQNALHGCRSNRTGRGGGGNVPIWRSPDLNVLPHQATAGLLCPRPLVSLAHPGLRMPCFVPKVPWLLLSWNANYVCGASQHMSFHGTTPVAACPVQGVIVL